MKLRSLAAAATLSLGLFGLSAQNLETPGPPVPFSELLLLERLNAAVRYDPAVDIEANWSTTYDKVVVVEIRKTRGRYALFEDDAAHRIDVAIRGTVNLRNSLLDLEFMKRRSARLGIYLHSGFETAAEATYEDLKPRLPEGYSLRICGHSLGAAEAIILGMLLEHDGVKVSLIFASAPPKVTDSEGWERFADLPILRLAGAFDPVPFLPPRDLMYGRSPYSQGGKLLFLLDGERYTILDGSFFDDIPDALKAAGPPLHGFDVADHLLPAYLGRLLPKVASSIFTEPGEWKKYAMPAKEQSRRSMD